MLFPFGFHGCVLTLLLLLTIAINRRTYLGEEHLLVHVGHKEEGLDERVEVAGVAYVFEAYGGPVLAHSLVKCEGLRLQTGLDGSDHV